MQIKNKTNKKLIMLLLSICFVLLISSTAFADRQEYNAKTVAYPGVGCYMQVYNNRTHLYYAGVFNVDYENNLVITNGDFRNGDVLTCDAYTSFSYGSYWVYKGPSEDTLSQVKYYKETDRTVEHLNFSVTINSKVTKVSCSASYNSQDGEQLSVTMYSVSDTVAPTISVSSERPDNTKVLINHYLTINGSDNNRVVGWKVTNDALKSPLGFTNFATPGTNASYQYKCTTEGTYYAWVIDADSNVSNYIKFTVGTSPVGTVSAPGVRETESTTYTCTVASGTSPYTYQWYKLGQAAANKINGATSATYTYTGIKSDDTKMIYCAVDNGYDVTFIGSPITVYYKPTVNATITPTNGQVIKNGSATVSVAITANGNPNSYTYQWYSASDTTSPGNKVAEATSSSYVVRPIENQTTYYYCVVNNTYYDVTSNRVCMKADVSQPTIAKGPNFNENIYINEDYTLTYPLVVTDIGQGYTTSSFQASDIVVKVNNEVVTPSVKTLTYKNNTGATNYNYELTLKGLTKNGKLSFEIPANGFTDNFGNGNIAATISTNIEVDNTDPIVYFSKVVSGGDQGYLSSRHTDLVVELYVDEKIGLDTNLFTSSDIKLKTVPNGSNVTSEAATNESYSKTLLYSHKDGTKYYYTLTLSRIPGNGQLYVYIPTGSFHDWANNNNARRDSSNQFVKVTGIIIDNTPPVVSVTKRLNNYTSGPVYPTSLESWHENWSNQNIYVTVNATDEGGEVDYYQVSRDNKARFVNMLSNQEIIKDDYDGIMYYRVYDKAGNHADTTDDPVTGGLIRLDKTKPAITRVILREERATGAEYVYNPDKPINKTIYAMPAQSNDLGEVQSGIKLDEYNGIYKSYYSISQFVSADNRTMVGAIREVPIADFNPVELEADGYYEFQSTTYDLAGNFVVSEIYKMHIKKRTNNIITLKNLNDVGSGIDRAEIIIYSGSSDTGTVLKQSTVRDLSNEYKTSVSLGKGTFLVKAILYDKVGNSTTLTKIINNSL